MVVVEVVIPTQVLVVMEEVIQVMVVDLVVMVDL